EFLTNHQAMKSGMLQDINNPWIVPAFYEKWTKKKPGIALYENPEKLQQRITEARRLAAKVRIVDDKENGRVAITLPEFNEKDLKLRVDTTEGQFREPGTAYAYYKNKTEHGGLFI